MSSRIHMITRAVAFAAVLTAAPGALAQSDDADLEMRIQRLENQLRQLTGQNEELQYRNRQLEERLRALGGAPAAQPNVAAAPPAYPQQQPGYPQGGYQQPAQQGYPQPGRYPQRQPGYEPQIAAPAPIVVKRRPRRGAGAAVSCSHLAASRSIGFTTRA